MEKEQIKSIVRETAQATLKAIVKNAGYEVVKTGKTAKGNPYEIKAMGKGKFAWKSGNYGTVFSPSSWQDSADAAEKQAQRIIDSL